MIVILQWKIYFMTERQGIRLSEEKNRAKSAVPSGTDAVSEETGIRTDSPACPGCKKKERSPQEYKDLIHRLNRIEGQVRGIRGMVEKDAWCPDILVQVAAVNAALNSFNKVLLANHIRTCVTHDILEGKGETVDELVTVLQKLMK